MYFWACHKGLNSTIHHTCWWIQLCGNLKPCTAWMWLTAHNWQKWKSTFRTCHCHEIYREEAAGLKNSNWKKFLENSEIFSPILSGHCGHVQTEFSSLKGWVSKLTKNFWKFCPKSWIRRIFFFLKVKFSVWKCQQLTKMSILSKILQCGQFFLEKNEIFESRHVCNGPK